MIALLPGVTDVSYAITCGLALGVRTAVLTVRGIRLAKETSVIRKLASGQFRLYSRKKDPKTGKRRNLGTFKTRAAAEKHERAVQFFKRGG
jgi:hypothetical protein